MRLFRYLSVAALVLAASCLSTDAPANPTGGVAALVDQTGITGYAMAAAFTGSGFGAIAAFSVPSTGALACAYSAADQRFDCAPMTANGMTITRSYALLDASGHSLSAPDVAAIASIRSITDLKGTMTGTGADQFSLTIDRHEDATLSDLHSATHALNGTATQHVDFAATGLSLSENEASVTADLRLPQLSAGTPWPLGGTITTDRTSTIPGSSGSSLTHEVITFDGTSVMTLTATMGGMTSTCKFDLAHPAIPPVCS